MRSNYFYFTQEFSGDKWAGYFALMWEKRKVYGVSVVKTEGKGPLWKPRLRWEYNI
jgi:hypothetical protein